MTVKIDRVRLGFSVAVSGVYTDDISFGFAGFAVNDIGIVAAWPCFCSGVGDHHFSSGTFHTAGFDRFFARALIVGIEPAGEGVQVILAEVPFAEMTDYVIALRASTQGRGKFDFDFIRYDEVPQSLMDKIIAEAKRDQ